MLTGSSFTEESVEGIIATTDCFIGWHLSIWLNAVLEAKEFPTSITYLNAALADVN
jgi:hypothetical protein